MPQRLLQLGLSCAACGCCPPFCRAPACFTRPLHSYEVSFQESGVCLSFIFVGFSCGAFSLAVVWFLPQLCFYSTWEINFYPVTTNVGMDGAIDEQYDNQSDELLEWTSTTFAP